MTRTQKRLLLGTGILLLAGTGLYMYNRRKKRKGIDPLYQVYKMGDKGEAVKQLQKAINLKLMAKGFDWAIVEDGIFGQFTKEGIYALTGKDTASIIEIQTA